MAGVYSVLTANAHRSPTMGPLHDPAEILSVTDLLGVIAASYGVVMAVSPALQIRRMLVTRSSADVSVAYLGVLEVGFALWFAYGVALGNLAIVIPNTVAFTVGLATLLVVIHFRRGLHTPA